MSDDAGIAAIRSFGSRQDEFCRDNPSLSRAKLLGL